MSMVAKGASRIILAATAFGVLFSAVAIAPAYADPQRVIVRNDNRHYEQDRRKREREYERRHREWRDQGRVYYGERVYVAPPPVVYYAPPRRPQD